MDSSWAQILLFANLLSHAVLLTGATWCVAFPSRRIYPMERANGWYFAMWVLFAFVFISNPLFVYLDWNTGLFPSSLRFWLAIPMVLLGAGLVAWGMATLGAKRTSGLADELIAEGPYLLTRNPQYVGDFLIFTGVALLSNSSVVMVAHLLTALVLLLAPFAEEPWLESHYGDDYAAYRLRVPRYL